MGELCPLYAPSGKFFCTRGEYFTMSNGIFNFNFLALVFSEILGGSQIYTRGPTPPGRRYRRNFFTQSEYITICNCVFNFNILALVVSDILRGLKFTLGGPVPPCTPLAEIFFVPQASTLVCLTRFKFQLSSSTSFRDFVPLCTPLA